MMRSERSFLRGGCWTLAATILLLGAAGQTAMAQVPCPANPAWVTNPSQPNFANDPNTLCGFYQYAWQSFLYDTAPASNGNGALNYETWPSLSDAVGSPKLASFAAKRISTETLFMDPHTKRTRVFNVRGSEPLDQFHQAGSKGILVDQNGFVTYYEQFLDPIAQNFFSACLLSRKACETAAPWQPVRFPTGAIELKVSYRVLPPGTPGANTYYTLQGVKVYNPKTKQIQVVNLGLVGYHLVFTTAHHPELIWTTFEHIDNAPTGACVQGKKTTPPYGFPGWAFNNVNVTDCSQVNIYPKDSQGNPLPVPPPNYKTQSYLNWAYGSDPGNQGPENTATLQVLNANVLKILPGSSVWRNYYQVGGIWTNGTLPAVGAGTNPPGNEFGGLFLSNGTLETFTQTPNPNPQNKMTNCFSCHNTAANGQPPYTVSHAVGLDQKTACATTLPAACAATQAGLPVPAH